MAKILIIDDEKSVRETIEMIVVSGGHTAHCANDGCAGLKTFVAVQPDLVITDILMPEKEGIETIIDLRRLRPDVPIIAVSGGGRVGNMSFLKAAERFGASRTLSKPFSPTAVLAAVAELLPKAT